MCSKTSLIVLAVLAVCIVAKSNNYEWGRRTRNDTLIFNTFVNKDGTWMRNITLDIHYPNTTNVYQKSNRTITYIRVMDQFTNGTGASAKLTNGGIGYKTVKIQLKSQRSKGIKSVVEIYGY